MKINDSTKKRKTNLCKTRVSPTPPNKISSVLTGVVAAAAGEMQGAEQAEPGETVAVEE